MENNKEVDYFTEIKLEDIEELEEVITPHTVYGNACCCC